MQGLTQYIDELKKLNNDFENELSIEIDEASLEKLDKKYKGVLSEDFKELYKTLNGEKSTLGFVAGFELLSVQRIISELDFFKKDDYIYEPVGTEAIIEKPMCKNKWIPFAFDGSECFLAIDLSPAKKGKLGQVIGIDLTENASYLMADSVDTFFLKMAEWVKNGSIIFDNSNDELSICEKSGHLFNNISDYAEMISSVPRVMVKVADEYWIKKYEKNIKKEENGDCLIASTILARESGAYRIMYNPVDISCEPFQYMDKVKELIIHDSTLRDFECLCKMPNLTSLYIIGCKLVDSDLAKLSELPKLKKLSIGKMGDTKSIEQLSKLKSLKELTIRNVEDFDAAVLGKFTGLTSLELENVACTDNTFLLKLTKIKTLKLSGIKLDNLDSIISMSKLEEFEMKNAADDESALENLSELSKLNSFIYPVKDLSIYQNHPSIETVGIASDNNGQFEAFKDSKVRGFVVFAKTEAEMKTEISKTEKEMKKYVKLSSWGGRISE